jgi:hypothetical protein
MKTPKARTFLIAGLLLAVAFTGPKVAQAQSCSVDWTGKAGDGLWYTAGNWSTNQVPGPTDDVCILTGGASATGTPPISVHSIQVGQSAELGFGSGTVSIATTLTVQAPQSAQYASAVFLSGTNLNCPSVDLLYGGALLGYGTVQGSITNGYYIQPGFGPNVTGLQVTGNYTQTSSGELSAQWPYGTFPPGELTNGLLNVTGTATLSGVLTVSTSAPKFPPKPGSSFTIMTVGSRSGKFTTVYTGAAKVGVQYSQDSVVAKAQ